MSVLAAPAGTGRPRRRRVLVVGGGRRRRAERARRRGMLRAAGPVRPDSILAVLAAVSIAGGALFLLYAVHFDVRHRTATGTVTAVRADQSCGAEACDGSSYRITVRYRPADGRPVTFVTDGFDDPLTIGAHLPVYYVPGTGYASLFAPSDKEGDGVAWIIAGLLLFWLRGSYIRSYCRHRDKTRSRQRHRPDNSGPAAGAPPADAAGGRREGRVRRSRWSRPPPSPSSCLTATLTGHGGAVNAVTFSPRGRLLASGGRGGRAILWDVTDPEGPAQLAVLTHPALDLPPRDPWTDESITAVAFSPDGRLLASGGAGRTALLWDVADPAHPDVLATLAHPPPASASTAGRRYRANDLYRAYRAVDATSFSPDGRLLACGCGKAVTLWDIADPARPVRRAVLARSDRPTRWWRPEGVSAAGFRHDGRLLATSGLAARNDAIIWDVTDPGHPARMITVGPRGHQGAVMRAVMKALGPSHHVHAVEFSPDGRLLAVARGKHWESEYGSGSEGSIALWDLANPAHPAGTGTLGHSTSGETYAVAFSPDQRLLASGHENATVTLWDVSDPAHPAETATLTGHHSGGKVRAVAFSPDGRLLASGSTDGTVKLWDVP